MDPITQGVVGVSASQLVSTHKQRVLAAFLGFFSGMAADLDVLIGSSTDPLLSLEYHRHFTHSLIFIPVGALLCTVVFRLLFKRRLASLSFKKTYLFCFLGYATHAVLDACTTYGTQLFWPFSNMRVAWNNVSVVDPLFTIPLLALMIVAVFGRSSGSAMRSSALVIIAALYVFVYLALGVLQNHRAHDHAEQLALSRGHTPINLGVKPSFANLVVWKSVYEYQGRYYVDAIRVLGNSKIYPGVSTPTLDLDQHFPWLDKSSQQAKDVERFRWFSNQYLGLDPDNPNRIIDIRYSLLPNKTTGMWGIELDPNATNEQHVVWNTTRPKGAAARQNVWQLWLMIKGVDDQRG